jgi:Prenyltransferase and squalene oxidase repeat
VTTQKPEFLEYEEATDERALPRLRRRANADAVAAGLDYLAGRHENGRWSDIRRPEFDSLNSACVLAFLSEVAPSTLGSRLRENINESLNWLLEAHTADGGWKGSSGKDEAGPTAWSILALKRNGRKVPQSAIEWLWSCRGRDGGFVNRPGDPDASALEVTAVTVQALGRIDGDAEKFLCARLQSEAAEPSERLAASAAILDCEKSVVPFPLLNQACQITAGVCPVTAQDRALLLRCLLRLRLTRAWALADGLRAAQRFDGSWVGTAEDHTVATAAASSALALFESQPGLYFGSDLPRPRRLHESS